MSGSVFDVKDFGAIGDGQTDDTAAFQRALAAIEALSPVTDPNGTFSDTRGAVLFVPFGRYVLTSTLRIRRQMIIQGVSGAGDFSGTKFTFARDIDGIVIERQDIPNVSRFGAQFGDWTVIRDVAVQSDSGFAFSQAPNPSINEDEPISASSQHIDHEPLRGHGVVLNSRARLVSIQGSALTLPWLRSLTAEVTNPADCRQGGRFARVIGYPGQLAAAGHAQQLTRR